MKKTDYLLLVPGIYISKVDEQDGCFVTTFDIRMKRPNFEDCMSPGESNTIEHIGSKFLEDDVRIKNDVIYFGSMSCLTGFNLILYGDYSKYKKTDKQFLTVVDVIRDLLRTVMNWNGDIPYAKPTECGNYRLQDLTSAKNTCANMLVLLDDFEVLKFEYPTADNSPELCRSVAVNEQKIHKVVTPEMKFDYKPELLDEAKKELEERYRKSLESIVTEPKVVKVKKPKKKKFSFNDLDLLRVFKK
jgi:S-ribosylhomocysteine lyase